LVLPHDDELSNETRAASRTGEKEASAVINPRLLGAATVIGVELHGTGLPHGSRPGERFDLQVQGVGAYELAAEAPAVDDVAFEHGTLAMRVDPGRVAQAAEGLPLNYGAVRPLLHSVAIA
jgi:hypothetical protein